jgi:hypothetical protein
MEYGPPVLITGASVMRTVFALGPASGNIMTPRPL